MRTTILPLRSRPVIWKWVEVLLVVRVVTFFACTTTNDSVVLGWSNGINSFLWGVLVLRLSWGSVLCFFLSSPRLYDWIAKMRCKSIDRGGNSCHNGYRFGNVGEFCTGVPMDSICLQLRDCWFTVQTVTLSAIAWSSHYLLRASEATSASEERHELLRSSSLEFPAYFASGDSFHSPPSTFPPCKFVMDRAEHTVSGQSLPTLPEVIGKRKGL